MLARAERICRQQRNDKNKLYSLHAPEVECIAKGKAHKKYEFGCKVSLVSTSKDNWIVGVQALHGNPYDGHTLKDALAQSEQLTGWRPEHAYCDKGYKGAPKHLDDTAIHLASQKKRNVTPRNGAGSSGEAPSSRSSATRRAITGWTATTSRAKTATKSTPSWPGAAST